MKFFWKIFFSMMFLCVSFFSIGGYFFINSSFNAAMEQEIQSGYQMCDIVHYSFQNEVRQLYFDIYENDEINLSDNKIINIVYSIGINNTNRLINFRIFDDSKNIIYSSNNSISGGNLTALFKDKKAYNFEKIENEIYLKNFRPTVIMGKYYYIEVFKNVSNVFYNRNIQYEMFLKITMAILVLGGIISALISRIITGPIDKLTTATNKIASGNFNEYIETNGNDELTELSRHFNIMVNHIRNKMKELEENAEKQELFVASFAHELKTPLTSIIGYADMLRLKKMTEEKINICSNYIFKEGKRLETLSMRLLEVIVMKKQNLILKKVPTTIFFKEIESSVKPILDNKNIKYVANIEMCLLYIESDLMKTVFINIIDNARKAIVENGQIEVIGKKTKSGYEIIVKDNGSGMEKSHLNKITKAFYMVDKSRSRKEGGCGLGLSLCEEILKLHGAFIRFESVLNKGTTVTLTIKGEEIDENNK